jgi:hypothetical protein
VIPYNGLNLEFANFETPCMSKWKQNSVTSDLLHLCGASLLFVRRGVASGSRVGSASSDEPSLNAKWATVA